ncbi:MAG: hypothetical protein FWG18_03975, partial [Alphaproteobacteria bacterium]|nr:hypothetical protein [Alphaproteobacteria bacterium]
TAAQAAAMKKATEGENAMTADKSAAKALLNAIMNSIRGEDTNVGGKFTDLNSIAIRMDTAASFGAIDDATAISSYNGANLYTAIYGRCREAVRADCTDASLQRAVTAYLMAIEQDCNTVQRMLDEAKKQLTANVREGGAMLNLARVENRQKHNALDATACLRQVEEAITSEQVCGTNYRKCLDNGQFIDVTTGRPFIGVVNFYQLANLLNFAYGTDVIDQRLAQMQSNRAFVTNFESRVRQFAEPVLDKCRDIAKDVWADYLDKAMLDIHYAQREKVAEIKAGCMDFVSACYMNGEKALTASMSSLVYDAVSAQPDFVKVSDEICREYIQACDYMFAGTQAESIVAQYIENRRDTDLRVSCRAVVKQCFDRFGGNDYANFYNRSSGLFATGQALDWFSFEAFEWVCPLLPPCMENEKIWKRVEVRPSQCARQLMSISACNPNCDEPNAPADCKNFARDLFGGFYKYINGANVSYGNYNPIVKVPELIQRDSNFASPVYFMNNVYENKLTGVATEVYYQTVKILENQCYNYLGRFVEKRYINPAYNPSRVCFAQFVGSNAYGGLEVPYVIQTNKPSDSYWAQETTPPLGGCCPNGLAPEETDGLFLCKGQENMCPSGYEGTIDTASWGACHCWENGGRRSGDGTKIRCEPGSFDTGVVENDNPVFKQRHVIPIYKETEGTNAENIANKVCPMGPQSETVLDSCAGINMDEVKNRVPNAIKRWLSQSD